LQETGPPEPRAAALLWKKPPRTNVLFLWIARRCDAGIGTKIAKFPRDRVDVTAIMKNAAPQFSGLILVSAGQVQIRD
jgi:hypothetical protein